MTKERKLAIEMWNDIRNMLSTSNVVTNVDIMCYKDMFCNEHGLRWLCDCWFCQYIERCSKCPLKSCKRNRNGHYSNVLDKSLDKDTRIAACNAIVMALGGKVND